MDVAHGGRELGIFVVRKGETGVTPVVSALPRIFVVRKGETGVTPVVSALPRFFVSGAPPERDQIRCAPS